MDVATGASATGVAAGAVSCGLHPTKRKVLSQDQSLFAIHSGCSSFLLLSPLSDCAQLPMSVCSKGFGFGLTASCLVTCARSLSALF